MAGEGHPQVTGAGAFQPPWLTPLEGYWCEATVTVRWGPRRPEARFDVTLQRPHGRGGARKFTVWANPPETVPFCVYDTLKELVNVISAAERDYWLNYRRTK